MNKNIEKGYVYNCLIKAKNDGQPLFVGNKNDNVIATLDGYAIVPRDEYEKLWDIAVIISQWGSYKENPVIELAKEVTTIQPQVFKTATNDTNL